MRIVLEERMLNSGIFREYLLKTVVSVFCIILYVIYSGKYVNRWGINYTRFFMYLSCSIHTVYVTGLNYIQKVLKWTWMGSCMYTIWKGRLACNHIPPPADYIQSWHCRSKLPVTQLNKTSSCNTAFLLYHWHITKAHFSLQVPSELYRLPPGSASKLQQFTG